MSASRLAEGDALDRLCLLASALAARSLTVRAAPGEPAWTDGTSVFLDPAAAADEQLQMLAVQASLVAAGSLEPSIMRRLVRRPAVARRYLAIEGWRALAANADVLPPSVRALTDLEIAARTRDPESSLATALNRAVVEDAPAAFGMIRPRSVLAAMAAADDVTAAQPAAPQARAAALPEIDDGDDEYDLGSLVSSPVTGAGPIGRLLGRMFSSTRGPRRAGPVGADAPTHVGRTRAHGRATVQVMRGAPVTLDDAGALASHGARYPEWDVTRRQYRADWCTVLEIGANTDEQHALGAVDGRALRRPLARLGIGLDRCHRRTQGDDIDLDAAIEAHVQVLAECVPDEGVYVETVRRRRDLWVLGLLDVSGSAAEPGPMGDTVHHHQRLAAATLTAALHDLGDRVALYAFNSRGRTAVQMTPVKPFDERLDRTAFARLAGLAPAAYTRLGAAIRHAASLVDARGGTARRLLVVLSDGFAYDHGYEGRYAEADARRALAEARRSGVGCLCLSVGASTPPAALRRVFGTAAHAVVPTVEQLPEVVGPLFRTALRSAEAQRRVFQRKTRARERLGLETSMA
jgi:hypothetical protein